jgi:hypothetical protein
MPGKISTLPHYWKTIIKKRWKRIGLRFTMHMHIMSPWMSLARILPYIYGHGASTGLSSFAFRNKTNKRNLVVSTSSRQPLNYESCIMIEWRVIKGDRKYRVMSRDRKCRVMSRDRNCRVMSRDRKCLRNGDGKLGINILTSSNVESFQKQ